VYEDWMSTRFAKDRVFSDEIANIIRDGPLRLPERNAWQMYMNPQIQNFREMKHMEAAEEGKANQRLLREEVLEQQRGSEPGPAVDIGFVANAVNMMNGSASAMQQLADGLQPAHQAHVDGIALQSRQEVERLFQEIRAEHGRNRIAREASSSLIGALHADRMRMEAAVAQGAQSMNVPTPTVDHSTSNEHMAAIQANLQRQQEGF
jgi:hypothetical protein